MTRTMTRTSTVTSYQLPRMESNRFLSFFRYLNYSTLKKTISCIFSKRLMGLSSEIAFNAMLALFPAILAILTAIGMFEASVTSTLSDLAILLKDIVPQQVWTLLLNFVQTIKPVNNGWFSIGFLTAIWIFSGALSAAMNALDRISEVTPEKKRPFWTARIISIVLAMGTICLLILASFLLSLGDFIFQLAVEQNWKSFLLNIWGTVNLSLIIVILVTAFGSVYQIDRVARSQKRLFWKVKSIVMVIITTTIGLVVIQFFMTSIFNMLSAPEINQNVASLLLMSWRMFSWTVALGIVAVAFAFIYRFGPTEYNKGTPILPGAILAAISWVVISSLFRLYVSNFGQYNKVYGAVGTVIVLMLWLQISALVMLIGNQVNLIVGEAMEEKDKKILGMKAIINKRKKQEKRLLK